ncbi:MAG: DUF1772 domain-containing protein [Ginsengibacter sp.]
MSTIILRFLHVVISGLLAGILLAISLGYNPKNLSATTYIEQQQNAIRALNTLMPLIGLVTIILTLVSASMQKDNKAVFAILLIAAILLVTGALVTRLGNQPINKIVMTWNAADPPNNWPELRDKWWSLHMIRTTTSLIAFLLIAWTAQKN